MKKMFRSLVYKFVYSAIYQADDTEINEIINTITHRYANRFPDWEIVFLSMPRYNREERKRTVEYICKMINRSDFGESV